MIYKIFADMIVGFHFLWILFMIVGFLLTLYGFFWKEFFDWWLFRTIHLFGILYVTSLAFLREYCPVTILENILREKYNPNSTYPGSFIFHYLHRLVYPEIEPGVLFFFTGFIAVFSLFMFIVRPPERIKRIFTG